MSQVGTETEGDGSDSSLLSLKEFISLKGKECRGRGQVDFSGGACGGIHPRPCWGAALLSLYSDHWSELKLRTNGQTLLHGAVIYTVA
jgi:hypothetical protein